MKWSFFWYNRRWLQHPVPGLQTGGCKGTFLLCIYSRPRINFMIMYIYDLGGSWWNIFNFYLTRTFFIFSRFHCCTLRNGSNLLVKCVLAGTYSHISCHGIHVSVKRWTVPRLAELSLPALPGNFIFLNSSALLSWRLYVRKALHSNQW